MLIDRYHGNPILTKKDVPYPVATVHNAGVVRYKEKYIMIFRSHKLNGRSILGKAESKDGFNFIVDEKPFMVPSTEGVFQEYEEYGVEDPRIIFLNGEFLITYSAYSRNGVRIGLAKTTDFKSVHRVSLITEADYRNVVIFPEMFNGLYARLDRPHSEISPWSIWISYSPDLKYWGESKLIMKPCQYHWDEMKIGPGAPPWVWPYMIFMTLQKLLVSAMNGYCNQKTPSKSPDMFIMWCSVAVQCPKRTEPLKSTGVVPIQ